MRCITSLTVCLLLAVSAWCAETAVRVGTLDVAKDTQGNAAEIRVVDAQDKPVAGAMVRTFAFDYASPNWQVEVNEVGKPRTTDAEGRVRIEAPNDETGLANSLVIAVRKEGLGLNWVNWHTRSRTREFKVALGDTAPLAGRVVDEQKKPIKGASVQVLLYSQGERYRHSFRGVGANDWMTGATDADGRFRFEGLPADVGAALLVRAPGHARVYTWRQEESAGFLGHIPIGKEDVEVVLPTEAVVEGRAVNPDGTPAVGVRMVFTQVPTPRYLETVSCVTDKDGRFHAGELHATEYAIVSAFDRHTVPDLIVDTKTVNPTPGATLADVTIKMTPGAIIEATCMAEGNPPKPIPGVWMSVRGKDSLKRSLRAMSDAKGLCRLRVVPGEYEVYRGYAEGYRQEANMREVITLAAGETKRFDTVLVPLPKLTGVVTGQDGKPAEGVTVLLMPHGTGSRPTGADGRYEVTPPSWAYDQSNTALHVIARDPKRNLAACIEVDDIEGRQDIALKPGGHIRGSVVDEAGQPLAKARIRLHVRFDRTSYPMQGVESETDADGRFELPALPGDTTYHIYASAKGYGQSNESVDLGAGPDAGVTCDPIKLLLANRRVSGVVIDSDGKPVASAYLYLSGNNQPATSVPLRTDKDGKFAIENVCEGRAYISASTRDGKSGSVSLSVEGDMKDTKITVAERAARTYPSEGPSVKDMTGRPLPPLKALGLQEAEGAAAKEAVLLCFWSPRQRPSRHVVRQLAEQKDALAKRGVHLMLVADADRDAAAAWLKTAGIDLPLGVLPEAAHLGRWNGVASDGLPLLILTDPGHRIRSIGFMPRDLDARLKAVLASPGK